MKYIICWSLIFVLMIQKCGVEGWLGTMAGCYGGAVLALASGDIWEPNFKTKSEVKRDIQRLFEPAFPNIKIEASREKLYFCGCRHCQYGAVPRTGITTTTRSYSWESSYESASPEYVPGVKKLKKKWRNVYKKKNKYAFKEEIKVKSPDVGASSGRPDLIDLSHLSGHHQPALPSQTGFHQPVISAHPRPHQPVMPFQPGLHQPPMLVQPGPQQPPMPVQPGLHQPFNPVQSGPPVISSHYPQSMPLSPNPYPVPAPLPYAPQPAQMPPYVLPLAPSHHVCTCNVCPINFPGNLNFVVLRNPNIMQNHVCNCPMCPIAQSRNGARPQGNGFAPPQPSQQGIPQTNNSSTSSNGKGAQDLLLNDVNHFPSMVAQPPPGGVGLNPNVISGFFSRLTGSAQPQNLNAAPMQNPNPNAPLNSQQNPPQSLPQNPTLNDMAGSAPPPSSSTLYPSLDHIQVSSLL